MNAKKIVLDFYKSDALIDSSLIEKYIHPEIIIEWHSSAGFVTMDFDAVIKLTNELSRAYVRSKVKISHCIESNNIVAVNYSHYVKTIENPREEMLLAHFSVFWEIKDNKLFKGYQISQLPK
jgi:hypothetical protein